MHAELDESHELAVRAAFPEDYAAFASLFPELLVDDPVPSAAVWASALCPSTLLATRAGIVLGYCYFQEYADTGYVRNVVVAEAARKSGVGRALMRATFERLRAHGKRSWRLNVRSNNAPALALYRSMGMSVKYVTQMLRVPWSALAALPAGSAQVRESDPERDAALESRFGLVSGQLADARALGNLTLEATAESEPVGVAVFNPRYPGAFPFRARELAVANALLTAMRSSIPESDFVNLVLEDAASLAAALRARGASSKDEFLHLEAPLEP